MVMRIDEYIDANGEDWWEFYDGDTGDLKHRAIPYEATKNKYSEWDRLTNEIDGRLKNKQYSHQK